MPEKQTHRAVAHPTRTGAQKGKAERTPQAQREQRAARQHRKAAQRSRRNQRIA